MYLYILIISLYENIQKFLKIVLFVILDGNNLKNWRNSIFRRFLIWVAILNPLYFSQYLLIEILRNKFINIWSMGIQCQCRKKELFWLVHDFFVWVVISNSPYCFSKYILIYFLLNIREYILRCLSSKNLNELFVEQTKI